MMQELLHSRGPMVLTLTIFALGLGAMSLVAATSPKYVSDVDQVSGYGLFTSANAGQP